YRRAITSGGRGRAREGMGLAPAAGAAQDDWRTSPARIAPEPGGRRGLPVRHELRVWAGATRPHLRPAQESASHLPQPGGGKVGIEPGGGVRGRIGIPPRTPPPAVYPQFPHPGGRAGRGGLPGGRAGRKGAPPPTPAFQRGGGRGSALRPLPPPSPPPALPAPASPARPRRRARSARSRSR